MRDAAYAANIPASWPGIVAGYLGGPNALHVWSQKDWGRFAANKKLPIWVGGLDGTGEAWGALQALYSLSVKPGAFMALDMETRVDKSYVEAFGKILNWAGFKVFVYGSASTLFSNPGLNGYWVADYAGIGPFMYKGARLTQYASGTAYDSSTVKLWTYTFGTWWL
jgi:hypothetical protein